MFTGSLISSSLTLIFFIFFSSFLDLWTANSIYLHLTHTLPFLTHCLPANWYSLMAYYSCLIPYSLTSILSIFHIPRPFELLTPSIYTQPTHILSLLSCIFTDGWLLWLDTLFTNAAFLSLPHALPLQLLTPSVHTTLLSLLAAYLFYSPLVSSIRPPWPCPPVSPRWSLVTSRSHIGLHPLPLSAYWTWRALFWSLVWGSDSLIVSF